MIKELDDIIRKKSNREKAKLLQRFFKTGKGEYGEGDRFLGIVVPEQRKIVKEFSEIDIGDVEKLIDREFHEMRMIGLFILIKKFEKSNEDDRKDIFNLYLKKAKENRINNWDLIDLSAPNIIGKYLIDKNRDVLYKLAISSNLWEKRISILATFPFIRNKDFKDALKISQMHLKDKHDLMHKAVGWMLREIGKRDIKVLEDFLGKYYKNMPRTMLRYAIEKFPEEQRQKYLKGKI